ncbi:twin-arginine translocation signal domain-containing protein [Dactylosporangium siamense]|uniref:twin-arginine translocation signal domain-containing protein n=1 Tax=Dactylosporangium siamense TaxID=685454 RepID=UPI003570A5BF
MRSPAAGTRGRWRPARCRWAPWCWSSRRSFLKGAGAVSAGRSADGRARCPAVRTAGLTARRQ